MRRSDLWKLRKAAPRRALALKKIRIHHERERGLEVCAFKKEEKNQINHLRYASKITPSRECYREIPRQHPQNASRDRHYRVQHDVLW